MYNFNKFLSYGVIIALALILGGCLAPQLKPPGDKVDTLSKILVVPMETPPLEVFPDPLAEGAAGYGQNLYENLPFSLTRSENLYKHPGGVLTAGVMERDDAAPQQTAMQSDAAPGLRSLAALRDYWTSSLIIAEQAAAKLNTAPRRAVLSSDYRQLPLANAERTASLGNWQNAVQRWYNDETEALDYRQFTAGDVDAVLEVGVGAYRIFYGQVSLQVLLKLIDPASGRVIGRIDVKDYSVEDSVAALLGEEAEQFKAVTTDMGSRLVARSLSELGLSPAVQALSVNAPQTGIAAAAR